MDMCIQIILGLFFSPAQTLALRWMNHWSYLAVLKENLNWWLLLCTLMVSLQQRFVFDGTENRSNLWCLDILMVILFFLPTSVLLVAFKKNLNILKCNIFINNLRAIFFLLFWFSAATSLLWLWCHFLPLLAAFLQFGDQFQPHLSAWLKVSITFQFIGI